MPPELRPLIDRKLDNYESISLMSFFSDKLHAYCLYNRTCLAKLLTLYESNIFSETLFSVRSSYDVFEPFDLADYFETTDWLSSEEQLD